MGHFGPGFHDGAQFFHNAIYSAKLGDEAYGILTLWGLLPVGLLSKPLDSAVQRSNTSPSIMLSGIWMLFTRSLTLPGSVYAFRCAWRGPITVFTPILVSKVFHISSGLLADSRFILRECC